jgi:hypothetical protein
LKYISSILDIDIDEGEWSASLSGRFTPVETVSGINWIGGWVSPGAGLDAVE